MIGHVEILLHHNAWRRGEIEEQSFTPEQIGRAIDEAIADCSLRRQAEETCEGWRYRCKRADEKICRIKRILAGDIKSVDDLIERVRAVLNGEAA